MRVESKNSLAPGHFQSDTGPLRRRDQAPAAPAPRRSRRGKASRRWRGAPRRAPVRGAPDRRPARDGVRCTRRRRAARSALTSTRPTSGRRAGTAARSSRRCASRPGCRSRSGSGSRTAARSGPLPDQRVERRQQRPGRDPPRLPGLAVELGRYPPALDPTGNSSPASTSSATPLGLRDAHPEVVARSSRADAVGLGATRDQLALRVRPRRGRRRLGSPGGSTRSVRS